MTRLDVLALAERLTARDLAVLRTLRLHRLATTRQLQRMHFRPEPTGELATPPNALRVTQRVLRRLEAHRLIVRLQQRIGGVKRGSDSMVWHLDRVGDQLLSVLDGDHRRRYLEPGRGFITHSTAVTELAVLLTEAHLDGQLEELSLTSEPANWRRFNGAHGKVETLKPDLHAITVFGDYEDHWFLERDLATEHPSVVARKAQIYERHSRTAAYQREHQLYPAVLWVVPDQARVRALERALRASRGLTKGVHRVITEPDFIPTVLAGSQPSTT